jgi:hypothetical protein
VDSTGLARRRQAVIAAGTQAAGLLPIRETEIAALLRLVPFGARLAAPSEGDRLNGFALTLSMPFWLNEILGRPVALRTVKEIQVIEAHLLVYLQFVDDLVDGQSQIGSGDPDSVLESAHRRLARLFGRDDPFWKQYAALADEQAASVRWEIESRGKLRPPFDDELFRNLASKGALLRWPAAALARLAGRPEEALRLDDLFGRLLGVFLLLDDLNDFEEDAARGQINAVLCAGGAASRESLHFHAAVARGTGPVCAKGHRELVALRSKGPEGTFQRTCDYLDERFAELETALPKRCGALVASHLFGELAARHTA